MNQPTERCPRCGQTYKFDPSLPFTSVLRIVEVGDICRHSWHFVVQPATADFAILQAERDRMEKVLILIKDEGWHHNDPERIWRYAAVALGPSGNTPQKDGE